MYTGERGQSKTHVTFQNIIIDEEFLLKNHDFVYLFFQVCFGWEFKGRVLVHFVHLPK